ncbi:MULTISPECIES: hypothetical protein [unclassified Nocardia]|uniref:hypothetical protein n=1 Tax=unclassified Nocardia TaxID=2637762 RepID=UPI0033AFCBCE
MFDHLTARQRTVLDVLRPAGILTVDQIARGAGLSTWKARRALGVLFRDGFAFRRQRDLWQIWPPLRTPPRKSVR